MPPNCSQSVSYRLTLFLAPVISSTLKTEATRSSETSVFLIDPHGATCQKTAFFIVTAVKTSNSAIENYFEFSHFVVREYDERKF
jgi:hypothetical protein